MKPDFTLTTLKKLYSVVLEKDYKIRTLSEYLRSNVNHKIVILRHDVDRMVKNSLKIARLEHSLGIKSTFYFRYKKRIFYPGIIKEISSLGHEIGYHYEVVSKAHGNMEKGIELFKNELSEFRKIAEVNTICMHGSPLSRWDSRKLWETFDYRDFGIIGEPYFDIDYDQVAYFTDTGRRWNGEKVNIRDKVISGTRYSFRTTDELIIALRDDKLPDKVMINIHPQRWHNNSVFWIKELIAQNLKNMIKRFVIRNTEKNEEMEDGKI
jgi:hypothetical protein